MVSTPSKVDGLIPAFFTCFFHVVPTVPGSTANRQKDRTHCTIWTNKTGTNCVQLFGPECNYLIAFMYLKIYLTFLESLAIASTKTYRNLQELGKSPWLVPVVPVDKHIKEIIPVTKVSQEQRSCGKECEIDYCIVSLLYIINVIGYTLDTIWRSL